MSPLERGTCQVYRRRYVLHEHRSRVYISTEKSRRIISAWKASKEKGFPPDGYVASLDIAYVEEIKKDRNVYLVRVMLYYPKDIATNRLATIHGSKDRIPLP